MFKMEPSLHHSSVPSSDSTNQLLLTALSHATAENILPAYLPFPVHAEIQAVPAKSLEAFKLEVEGFLKEWKLKFMGH